MTVKIACVVFDCLDALVVGRFGLQRSGARSIRGVERVRQHRISRTPGQGGMGAGRTRRRPHVAVCPRAGVEESQEPLAPGCHRRLTRKSRSSAASVASARHSRR